ncbi:hypothetical protein DYH10_00140 [Candidatus Saccharibacteria bacterium CPR2]|nr:hypothetical protein [Candidatus Saccharibacteria bacterium CPR2]
MKKELLVETKYAVQRIAGDTLQKVVWVLRGTASWCANKLFNRGTYHAGQQSMRHICNGIEFGEQSARLAWAKNSDRWFSTYYRMLPP